MSWQDRDGAPFGQDVWDEIDAVARTGHVPMPESGEVVLGGPRLLHTLVFSVVLLGVVMLVMVGEHDVPDMLGVADALVTGIPGAEKRVIPGAGHVINIERPGTFNAALREFLDRIEKKQVSEQ